MDRRGKSSISHDMLTVLFQFSFKLTEAGLKSRFHTLRMLTVNSRSQVVIFQFRDKQLVQM